ncbi:MAG: DUF2325 domain-containing protein [Coriobacteriales bacterium]|jgi:hypothetical protein|nr:DUF2325 domain-containing protein [Coriobacteriales bacterium]
MSIVIIGGHERMECKYKDICKEYRCKSKVFTKSCKSLDTQIGDPDLVVLFTNPVSHEMAKAARRTAANRGLRLVQSHCGSGAALRGILDESVGACC